MIVWDHEDAAASRKAAKEMVALFGVVYQPSLTSRHIAGKAIDMSISWSGTKKIKNASETEIELTVPADGSNTLLHAVGETYGVVKNVKDPPHWSDNGK